MNQFDFNQNNFSIGDIGSMIRDMLDGDDNNLTYEQRQELERRQEQLQQQGGQAADQDKDSMFSDLLKIVGPILLGIAVKKMIDRSREQNREVPDQSQNYVPPVPQTPQYGSYQQGDTVYRSNAGGQSVEEVD